MSGGRMIPRRDFLIGTSGLAAGSLLGMGCGGVKVTPDFPQACDGDCAFPVVDVHCHVFNGSDLNVSGFISHILPLPTKLTDAPARRFHALIDGITPSGADELVALAQLDGVVRKPEPSAAPAQVQELANAVGGLLDWKDEHGSAERIVETLHLITRRRSQIAATLVDTYSQVDLFTPAMVDYTHWSNDAPETPLSDQLKVQALISQLAAHGRIGRPEARIHPIAPYNPLREVREVLNALSATYAPFGAPFSGGDRYDCTAELAADAISRPGSLQPLRAAIEDLGFVGAKVYPPVGFLPIGNAEWEHHQRSGLGKPLDLALRAFYAYCEAEDVPVMTHANESNGYATGFGILAGPEHWEKVLQEFPNLRLNLGHFGHLTGEDKELGLETCELWMRQIAVLMERYPNVYADTGFSPTLDAQEDRERYAALLKDLFTTYRKASKRLMYGSDYWLNTLSINHEAAVDGLSALFDGLDGHRASFMGRNALRFLGLLDDDDRPADTRNRTRLLKRYEGLERPSWLG